MAIEPINLPSVESVEELRRVVELALQRLAIRVDDPTFTTAIDLTNHQIKNLRRPTDRLDAVNVEYLEEQLKTPTNTVAPQGLTRRQKYLLQVGGGGGTSTITAPPEWVRVESTMTLGTTTVASLLSPSAGKYYNIILHQDTAGGRLVDWGTASAFKGVDGWQPDTTANTYSSFLFYCKASNNFQLVAPPITGVS